MHENRNSGVLVTIVIFNIAVLLLEPWRCTVLGDLVDGEDEPELEVAHSCSSASFLA